MTQWFLVGGLCRPCINPLELGTIPPNLVDQVCLMKKEYQTTSKFETTLMFEAFLKITQLKPVWLTPPIISFDHTSNRLLSQDIIVTTKKDAQKKQKMPSLKRMIGTFLSTLDIFHEHNVFPYEDSSQSLCPFCPMLSSD